MKKVPDRCSTELNEIKSLLENSISNTRKRRLSGGDNTKFVRSEVNQLSTVTNLFKTCVSELQKPWPKKPANDEVIICHLYHRTFIDEDSKSRHFKLIHCKIYACKYKCGAKFSDLSSQTTHEKGHRKDRKDLYTFTVCKKQFQFKSTLSIHETTTRMQSRLVVQNVTILIRKRMNVTDMNYTVVYHTLICVTTQTLSLLMLIRSSTMSINVRNMGENVFFNVQNVVTYLGIVKPGVSMLNRIALDFS